MSYLYSLQRLPANIALQLSLLWMVFALFFNYYLRGIEITKNDVISLSLVLLGLMIISYEKIFSNFKFENKFMVPIIILVFSQIGTAYLITTLKEYEDKISVDHLQLLDMGSNQLIIILVYFAYLLNPGNLWDVKSPDIIDVIKLSLLSSTIGYFKQKIILNSQKNLTENYYTLLSSLKVIITLVLCWLFMGEKITLYNVLGGVVITFGLLYKNIENNLYYHVNFGIK